MSAAITGARRFACSPRRFLLGAGLVLLSACVFPLPAAECAAPLLDCNGDSKDGCEVRVDVDPNNCGACGHSCLGGPCEQGRCGATLVAVSPGAQGIAVDGTSVYWSIPNARTLMRSDPSGGGARPLFSSSGHPRELVTDEQAIYFWDSAGDGTNAGSVMRVLTSGAGLGSLAVGQSHQAGRFALDYAYVYWSSGISTVGSGQVIRVSKLGGATATIASGLQAPHSVWLNGSALYWSDPVEGSVRRSGTGAGQLVDQGQGAAEIDGDSSRLNFVAVDAGEIRQVRLLDGVATVLATGQVRPRFLRYDQGTVWYASSQADGTWAVLELRSNEDGPQVVATSASISELAQDSQAIYWADPVQGLILKVAK